MIGSVSGKGFVWRLARISNPVGVRVHSRRSSNRKDLFESGRMGLVLVRLPPVPVRRGPKSSQAVRLVEDLSWYWKPRI